MIYSFVFFLLLFVMVGLASSRYSQKTTEDYLLASKNIKPWLAGFSFFATENSGFMFIGYIGLIYAIGLSALWVAIGWYLGEVLVLWRTARVLRAHNDTVNSQTYAGLISRWTGQEYVAVRYIAALIFIVFLSVYAAAQLSAGGKALNVLAGWDLNFSAVIGFLIVVAYCVAGGIRATIWTDAVQAIVMFVSLVLIVGFSLNEIGGLGVLIDRLNEIDPALLDMMAGSYKFGMIGFILGWLFAGMGVLGQAHVMVRFMVIDKAESVKKALIYYAGLVSILSILCVVAALSARVLLPELQDAELALPMLASDLMPSVLAGLFLAGLFAAAMSTADSQVLSSSAALTRDIVPRYKDSLLWSKAGTLLVALFALGVAVSGDKNVFKLATFAWSVMAAGLTPLILVYSFHKKPSQALAVLMMLGGAGASIAWELAGLSGEMYNVLPGLAAGLAIYIVLSPFMKAKT